MTCDRCKVNEATVWGGNSITVRALCGLCAAETRACPIRPITLADKDSARAVDYAGASYMVDQARD